MALAWPNHVHHARALTWFRAVRDEGWATCPVTESGFVRVSSNARAIPDARTPREAILLLRRLRELSAHAFWPDDVSAAGEGPSPFDRLVGHRQVTDAHLLSLALQRGGRLATFDKEIASLVPGRDDVVELIG